LSHLCGSSRARTVLQFDQFQFYSDSGELPERVDIPKSKASIVSLSI
jgi:hypothetical protein